MSKSIIVGLAASLSLSSAQVPSPDTATPAPAVVDAASAVHCDAGKASAVVGQLPTPETEEQARASAGAEVVRVLRHDQPITKEFRIGRLNLVLDAEGRIARVNCS